LARLVPPPIAADRAPRKTLRRGPSGPGIGVAVRPEEDATMIGTLSLDLTPALAPFGWGAVTLVMAGLTAIVVQAVRARRVRPDRAIDAPRSQNPRLAA
jgi:hypothetical protein